MAAAVPPTPPPITNTSVLMDFTIGCAFSKTGKQRQTVIMNRFTVSSY